MPSFVYSKTETDYLSKSDKILGAVIAHVGHIYRETRPDMFTALIQQIIGQQISSKAAVTVFGRLENACGNITPEAILTLGLAALQGCGMSMRKASYLYNIAQIVDNDELDLTALQTLSDTEVIKRLSAISGIGVWTAEMLMLFSMGRMNVISYKDLGIIRGMRMVYGVTDVSKEFFEQCRERYSPYASVASLYLWDVASGKYPEYVDPAKCIAN